MNRLLSPHRNATLAALVAASVAACFTAFPAHAQEARKDAAAVRPVKVNGSVIPAPRAAALLAEQLGRGYPDSPDLREAVREELARREAVTQAARRKGLDKKPEISGQMELAREAVLIRAYLQDYAAGHPVSKEAVRAEYDKARAEMGDKEYKARHILVEKEDEARDIIARLAKGEKFEDLAKASKDPGSRERGGELDWSSPGSYVKPFSDAMTGLGKGETTAAPVKSDFGWHVIRLDDVRPLDFPPLEQVAPGIEQKLQQQIIQQHILDLRKKAKVE